MKFRSLFVTVPLAALAVAACVPPRPPEPGGHPPICGEGFDEAYAAVYEPAEVAVVNCHNEWGLGDAEGAPALFKVDVDALAWVAIDRGDGMCERHPVPLELGCATS